MVTAECGALLIDKQPGMTSHDVVAQVRRSLGRKLKVGHAGTLDPFATGLLIVLLGRATRLQQYLLHLPKTYVVEARLGWRSTTFDREGELTRTGKVPADPQIAVGLQQQQVPAYSALQVGGERLYAKARRGEKFEPPTREIEVISARRISLDDDLATFEIECSGGTYVRSLVADLGDAYCQELRRTKIAQIDVAQANLDRIVDVNTLLTHIPVIDLDQDTATSVAYGRPFEYAAQQSGPHRLVSDGRLVAIAEPREGMMRPSVVIEAQG